MRELSQNEIGHVSGASNTGWGSISWAAQLTSANTGAWTAHFTSANTVAGTAQLTSVNKSFPVVNEIFKVINNLFGINIPSLTL
ncbi:hypothetical protein SAMN05428971_3776 [Candidatus Pantoea varia]|uniref:Uncharacterized protein n=1 Tax=Candidatus Pantoea varia TaxID=1881036 RepID=A0A1I5GR06_9GAMM|nr:hypothetical protein [Pantoea varia]SFO38422.1 hypothetical protein SAMN05428971_3776 [Pantoea varia]